MCIDSRNIFVQLHCTTLYNYTAPHYNETFHLEKYRFYLQFLIRKLKKRSASNLCWLLKLICTPSRWFVMKSRLKFFERGVKYTRFYFWEILIFETNRHHKNITIWYFWPSEISYLFVNLNQNWFIKWSIELRN